MNVRIEEVAGVPEYMSGLSHEPQILERTIAHAGAVGMALAASSRAYPGAFGPLRPMELLPIAAQRFMNPEVVTYGVGNGSELAACLMLHGDRRIRRARNILKGQL